MTRRTRVSTARLGHESGVAPVDAATPELRGGELGDARLHEQRDQRALGAVERHVLRRAVAGAGPTATIADPRSRAYAITPSSKREPGNRSAV